MGLPIFDAATLDPQIGGMRAGFVPDSTTGGPGDKIHPNRVHIVARSPRKAKWGVRRGGRPEDIQGLAVEEHVAPLRDQLLPLVERAHRTVRESVEAIGHMRQAPARRVERAEAVNIVLLPPASPG